MWENVKDTLRTTLIEINALVDALSIIKEGKYLAINPVASDPHVTNLLLFFSAKKRSIAAAADILIKGTERLRRRHCELVDARVRRLNPNVPPQFDNFHNSFHKALKNLRQEWRLKLHQNSILGDVSRRPAGSHCRESGNFEIREADTFAYGKSDVESQDSVCVDAVTGVMIIFSQPMEALISSSHGLGLLNVEFLKSDINLRPVPLLECMFNEKRISSCSKNLITINQRQKLFKAQRLLACREILSLLACEACNLREYNHLTGSIAFVTQDKIMATLFPGVQISLSYSVKPTVFCEDILSDARAKSHDKLSDHGVSVVDCSNCINLQLHRLLAAQHRAVWPNFASLPQPACGPVEIPQCYRSGGANGLSASRFSSVSQDWKFSSEFSVAVASVSGFASQAASALCVIHATSRFNSNSVEKTSTLSQRSQPIFPGQDRLSLFTEWRHTLLSGVSVQSVGFRHGVSTSVDDLVPGISDVAILEHTLSSRGVDEDIMKTVLGTNTSLFSQTIMISRHHYLRDQVYFIISELSQCSSIKIVARWDTFNSAIETSVRLCFYCTDYDAYRSWLGLTITSNGLVALYADPPRTYRLGMDLNRLKDVLSNQVLYTLMNYLDILAIKILGWTRLGNNPFSAISDPREIGDGPVMVKMFSSPSAK
ncbi:Mediator of RNA polymerase II transcription subunit 17 isoform 3 [Schistosoma japonicum]|nr:Mediator of RNA polymerase II transcription subunit 17 isoform 3 [Schistosoma japonicum]